MWVLLGLKWILWKTDINKINHILYIQGSDPLFFFFFFSMYCMCPCACLEHLFWLCNNSFQQELKDDLYQKIAAEMNLSDTAFITMLNPSDSFTTGQTGFIQYLIFSITVKNLACCYYQAPDSASVGSHQPLKWTCVVTPLWPLQLCSSSIRVRLQS